MTRKKFYFKAVANSCMRCHEPTNDPNPFCICDKCKAKENRYLELIDIYSNREKPLSAENLAEMLLNILKQKSVPIEYIFDVFDTMDKMEDKWLI